MLKRSYLNSPGLCLVPGVERDSFLWCPLLLEGLKPTRKKGLTLVALLAGCCPGLASRKRLRSKVLSGRGSHAVLLLLLSPKVVV